VGYPDPVVLRLPLPEPEAAPAPLAAP
jgi:hypothetical protein